MEENRVARQSQYMGIAQLARQQRLARTHGDAPEFEVHASLFQGFLHKVMIADGNATDGDQTIDTRGNGLFYGGCDLGHVVAGNTQIHDVGTDGLRIGGNGEIIWLR